MQDLELVANNEDRTAVLRDAIHKKKPDHRRRTGCSHLE